MECRAVEEAMFRAFIVRERRYRYLTLLESAKRRRDLCRLLAHCRDIDMRFARSIPSSREKPEAVERLLKALGAPDDCFVVSEASELDGKRMPLRLALEEIIGAGMGTLLSCVPGRLAYYEGEGPSDRFVLVRGPST